MLCDALPDGLVHSEDSQLCAAYSGDGGKSWLPVELVMHYTEPLIVVCGIQVVEKDGHPVYLLPAHRNTRRNDPLGDREQLCLSSTSLLEWKLAGSVPRPPGVDVFMHEGSIAEGDAPGELKMVTRTCGYTTEGKQLNPPRAFSSMSKDGGHTWSVGEGEPDLWNSVSKSYYGKSATGSHIYVYCDGPAWRRTSLRYKIQPAGGKWGEELAFYDGKSESPASEQGPPSIHNSYPTLIEHAPGEYYCVWDSGTAEKGRTHIRFGKLKLKQGN